LRDAGANAQRPLWASTGTKNPAYSDVLYVEALVAPDVVNTMPEATLRAFADHGEIGPLLETDASAAEETLRDAATAGIDLDSLTAELEREGVRSFVGSYQQVIACIGTKLSRPD
jgi:transaldolase